MNEEEKEQKSSGLQQDVSSFCTKLTDKLFEVMRDEVEGEFMHHIANKYGLNMEIVMVMVSSNMLDWILNGVEQSISRLEESEDISLKDLKPAYNYNFLKDIKARIEKLEEK